MLENFMTNSMTVENLYGAADTSGGPVNQPNFKTNGVACRVEDASAQLQMVYFQKQLVVTHRIFTTYSGIGNGYRLTIDDGRRMEVESVDKRRSIGTLDDFYVIMARELRPGD